MSSSICRVDASNRQTSPTRPPVNPVRAPFVEAHVGVVRRPAVEGAGADGLSELVPPVRGSFSGLIQGGPVTPVPAGDPVAADTAS